MNKYTCILLHFIFCMSLWGQDTQVLYDVQYGILKVGEARYTIENTTLKKDSVLKVSVQGETTGMWDWIYSVNDHFRSFINPKTGRPIKFIREAHEGSYNLYRVLHFVNDTTVRIKKKEYKTLPQSHDLLSAFYQLKMKNWDSIPEGDSVSINLFESTRNYAMILVKQGIETLDTEYGDIETYRLKPIIKKGKILQSDDALTFWISTTDFLPVRVEFDLVIGSLHMEITDLKSLTHEQDLRTKD